MVPWQKTRALPDVGFIKLLYCVDPQTMILQPYSSTNIALAMNLRH